MKKNLILSFALLVSLSIFSLETGKIYDNPVSAKQTMQISENSAVCSDFAVTGLKSKVLQKSMDYPIVSLAAHDSRILAGCGDFAKIIDVESGKELASFSEGEIVYSMVSVSKDILLAAIQPTGMIVRITNQKTDTVFVSEGKSINLLKKINNTVYAAIGNEIFIYKNNGFEKAFGVNDRNIIYLEEFGGYLYVSTEGAGKIIKVSIKENTQDVLFSMKSGEVLFFSAAQNRITAVANSSLPGQEGMEQYYGLLLSIEDSNADTIAKEEFPYSSCTGAFEGILISASVPGRFYYYDFKNYFYIGSAENDFIMSMMSEDKFAYAGTAKSNSVIQFSKSEKPSVFTSSVIDAQKDIFLTSFYPKTGKNGKLYVRTGATYSPDSSWSDFMIVKTQASESMNSARYIQYKYAFTGLNDTLYGMSFYYKTKNHPPKFKDATLYPERIMPDYANSVQWGGEVLSKRSFYPELKDNTLFKSQRNVRFIVWNCSDIDFDRLTYDLYLTAEESDFLIQKDLNENYFVINLESFSEGFYKAKIVASDSSDNADFIKTVMMTEEFYIDKTPCLFSKDKFEKSVLSFEVKDNSSKIDEVSFSVNGKEFLKAIPKDGVYDSKQEEFEIKIDREKNQLLSIVVRAVDSAGNVSSLTKVIK